ncbi:hypothetical protein HYV72_01620 [Candidatus Uhrbacteria bacterium]|nr:hypothetical protein [Candidatus Uhrbacteria bacterium]
MRRLIQCVVWLVPGPSNRVIVRETPLGASAALMNDPVYLSVTPPGDYETVTIDTRFLSRSQPLVELGATVNAQAGQIVLKPLMHETLDRLDWSKVEQDGLTLWQRFPRYISIDDFLARPPVRSRIATFHAELPEDSMVPYEWTSGGGLDQTSVSLRGFHEFVVATDGRDLVFDIVYMDMNRNPGRDPVLVRAYQDGHVLAEVRHDDDGIEADTQGALGRQTLRLVVRDPDPGVVKVELNANTDIYWREIHSSVPRLSFMRNVTIGDDVGYASKPRGVTLYTNAEYLTVFTRHAEGIQTIRVGDETLDIAVPHERYTMARTSTGVVPVVIPKGDLVLVTDGQIAFSREAFFDPFTVRLDDRTSLDRRGVDYVLAEYVPPKKDGDAYVARATFSLANLEREQMVDEAAVGSSSALRFVYSIPHVTDREASVEIQSITMVFERPPRALRDVAHIFAKRIGL